MLLCLLRLVSYIKGNICIAHYALFQILCSLLHIIIMFYLYLNRIRWNFTERKLQEQSVEERSTNAKAQNYHTQACDYIFNDRKLVTLFTEK